MGETDVSLAVETGASASEPDPLATARGWFGHDVVLTRPFAGRPPLWIEPSSPELRRDIGAAARWMNDHRPAVEQALLTFGAIVWRDFPVSGSDDFAALLECFETFSQGYVGGTSDRQTVKGQVMEATRTPREVYILLHQEMSYLARSPRLIGFYCQQPSPTGGETIICDMRGVLEHLPPALGRKFSDQEVRYVRNLRSGQVKDWRADPVYRHPSWQDRFGTHDRAQVERQLSDRAVSFRWEPDGSLTFWTQLPGVTVHPVTGERLLFNQINSQASTACRSGTSEPTCWTPLTARLGPGPILRRSPTVRSTKTSSWQSTECLKHGRFRSRGTLATSCFSITG